ncbi:MAG: ATP-binding protein [Natronospirillum sp.]
MSTDKLDLTTVMASTVHDVKNSLGMISADIETVAADLAHTDPEKAEVLRRILLEANRINSGLSHMLGVYRIDHDLVHPALDEILVLEVLEDAAARYAGTLENQHIEISIDCPDEELVWVMDDNLVGHVLTNILTNAIRYTSSHIILSAKVENGELCLGITDDGRGYPSELLNCLDPNASLRVKTSSTGLGIYFAHRIAELHRHEGSGKIGHIETINKPEGGAFFGLWLP